MMLKEDVRGPCASTVGKNTYEALGKETSPSTLRFVQAQKTAADGRTLRLMLNVMLIGLPLNSYTKIAEGL